MLGEIPDYDLFTDSSQSLSLSPLTVSLSQPACIIIQPTKWCLLREGLALVVPRLCQLVKWRDLGGGAKWGRRGREYKRKRRE